MLIQKLMGRTPLSTKLLHTFRRTAAELISKQNWEAEGEQRLGSTMLYFLTKSNSRVPSTEGYSLRSQGHTFWKMVCSIT